MYSVGTDKLIGTVDLHDQRSSVFPPCGPFNLHQTQHTRNPVFGPMLLALDLLLKPPRMNRMTPEGAVAAGFESAIV